LANFEIQQSWFGSTAPQNAKSATGTIGSGVDGTVTITVNAVGTEGNNYTIEVVEGSGTDIAMDAVLTGTNIVVTLGTDGVGALDATKNTATIVAGAIDSLSGVSATASGTGATALSSAEVQKNLVGGQYATTAPIPYTMLQDETYYYVNIKPAHEKSTDAWKRFTLADF